ncbi:MAG: DUF4402 domain-containing protein [Alphaproteobacteria bacterium]|nr:DUF4402 domain-containing protein [Alphaproteobacteria bacterium]
MRTLKKLGLLGIAAASMSVGAQAAHAASQTGNASAVIQNPIVITEDTAMDFATIIADQAGDTVTLTAAGSISASGSSTFSGSPAAGAFSVTGTPSAAVTLSFSTGDTLTGPGTAMPLGNFTNDAGGSPAFDGSGNLAFNVGADLTVNATQTAGSYSGTYTVTVDYQ